jgi:hypothetical protein
MTGATRWLFGPGSKGPDELKLLGLLLTPVAVAAGAVGAWRFGVDAGWTGTFFIAGGFLSHWQVWGAFAVSVQVCAWCLRRDAATRIPAGT